MGGINFDWLALWVPVPVLCRKLKICYFVRRLCEADAPGSWECGPCPDLALYTLTFALQLMKITENFIQCNRKALGFSVPIATGLFELVIAGNWLDCRPWLTRQAMVSTHGRRKFLKICHTCWFTLSDNFESKLSVRAVKLSANSVTPRSSCICLLLTYQGAPVAIRRHLVSNSCNLQTWGAFSGFPRAELKYVFGRMRCLYYRTPFLTDKSMFLFKRGKNIPFLLSSTLFNLIDVRWPDESWVWVHPHIMSRVELIGLVPRSVVLVGARWSSVRHKQRLWRCS